MLGEEPASDLATDINYECDYNGEDSDDDDNDEDDESNTEDDEDEDPFAGLDAEGKEKLLEETLVVRITLNKVCSHTSFLTNANF